MHRSLPFLLAVGALPWAAAGSLHAQWNPSAGAWLKSDPTDVRIMTWNVEDGICSSADKTEGLGAWEALARIVAGLQPDVLMLQEAGDNPSGGADNVAVLTNVCELFLHGGNDPYRGGQVTAYVQKYAPGYDLPHIFVSARTDGYNRNVILSRFPFRDLNGDTKATISDIPLLLPHLYQTGGSGGIRGQMFAELDLTDGLYAGDLVVGTAHYKAGGSSSDIQQRATAARNCAYVLDYWYQGGGLGQGPDPFSKIIDSPRATKTLDANTALVFGGDLNEDETRYTQRGPAAWVSEAANQGGTDGTDRDRSDMRLDDARHVFSGSRATQSSSKLDYLVIQDSITQLRREFLFNTSGTPAASLPPQVAGFRFPTSASGLASDHRPVLVDLILPVITCQKDLGFGGPGSATLSMCGGPLLVGNTNDLQVVGAAPAAPAWLVLGTMSNPLPIVGGTIVPIPPAAVVPIPLDPTGRFALPGLQGGGGPVTLYLQVFYQDVFQPQGFGFTNAVEAIWLP